MNPRRGFAAVALVALVSADAAAQQIDVRRMPCADEIELSVRGARFSDVLKRLAEKLGFALQFEATSDSIIDVEVSRPAPELVARLSPSDNVIVAQAADPRCPGRNHIVKVWVLPKAAMTASAAPVAGATPPRPAATAPPPADNATRYDPKRVDEMAKLAKDMYNEYVRINGVPPPTPEEEAAK